MKHPIALAVMVGLSLASNCALALDGPAARTVTVTGESEIKVAPDEVVLTLGAVAKNKDLLEVKKASDRRMKDLLAVLAAAGIANKDVQTDYLNIEPEYSTDSERRRVFVGYIQRTTVVVTLRNIAKFDGLLTSVLQAGVDHVHGIDFRTSELRRHRDQARALAIKAAKEKAIALAGDLGEKVGRPRSIQEGQYGWASSYRNLWARGSQNLSQNVGHSAGSAGQEVTLAPGSLSVRANVSVTFELE